MIKSKLLNSQAELNSFFELASIDYTPGQDLRIVFRIFNAQTDIRWVLDAADTVVVTFLDGTSTEVDITATALDVGDLSMYYIDLTPTQTTDLNLGNMQVEVTIAADSKVYKTVAYGAFTKNIISGDC